MSTGFTDFLIYFVTSLILLIAFIVIYARVTPYDDFKLIAQDNVAVAVVFSGAVLGFTFPLVASIYFTQSIIEMCVWALITCLVQLALVVALRKQARRIEEGHLGSAIMVATLSVAIGLLNAVSISF